VHRDRHQLLFSTDLVTGRAMLAHRRGMAWQGHYPDTDSSHQGSVVLGSARRHPLLGALHLPGGRAMPTDPEERRERQLRRAARRQGLALEKSRCRDERAFEYGGFMVLDAATNGVVAGGHPMAFSLSLDDVAGVLSE
jgi:hypothetical protein